MSDYQRIEQAIAYLVEHAAGQPSLEEIAAQVHLSPYHFQRLFCRWAGTTPKRFLQALTVERGKSLLKKGHSVLDASLQVGLSGTSRLHDHFVQFEAATPGEYKREGRHMPISYGVHPSPFGRMLLASTPRGICRASFLDFADLDEELLELQKNWPGSDIRHDPPATEHLIDSMFAEGDVDGRLPLSLHVAGTNFQVAVWRALLKIPMGALASYSQIAGHLGQPRASRAVGGAVGANPVAFLIPCHRVIQQSGALGGYRWGCTKKQMIQTWESLRTERRDT